MAPETEADKHILIADDNAFVREGIAIYFKRRGYEIVEADNSASALQVAGSRELFAAIIDIVLPAEPGGQPNNWDSEGIRLARQLKLSFPELGVLIFSAFNDRASEVLDLAAEGIRGVAYMVKGAHPRQVLEAMLSACNGQVVLGPTVVNYADTWARELQARLSPDELPYVQLAAQRWATLTAREREVAQLLADSRTTQGIADALSISTNTVEKHTTRIYSKLSLNDVDHLDPPLRKALLLAKACWLSELEKYRL